MRKKSSVWIPNYVWFIAFYCISNKFMNWKSIFTILENLLLKNHFLWFKYTLFFSVLKFFFSVIKSLVSSKNGTQKIIKFEHSKNIQTSRKGNKTLSHFVWYLHVFIFQKAKKKLNKVIFWVYYDITEE